jgi:uncharacterized protein YidB (DUF937 family)
MIVVGGRCLAAASWSACSALGADRINTLVAQTGMSRDELIAGLSQQLPEVIDQLSPEGRVPTDQEMARLL